MQGHDEPQAWSTDSAGQNASRPEATPNLLRESLHRVLIEERYGRSGEAKLRAALHTVCEHARREGLRIEHLLILLKECWRDLPEQARVPRLAADDTLARVVSACINEYYEEHMVAGDPLSRRIHQLDPVRDLRQSEENP